MGMILVSFYSEAMVIDQIWKMKEILSQVICIKLHVQNFEIFCYYSYNILIKPAEKIKLSGFQNCVVFKNQSIISDVIRFINFNINMIYAN